MKDKILLKFIETHRNAHIILDNNKKVIYANKASKALFSENVNGRLGDFVKCENTLLHGEGCQFTVKCKDCKLNKYLDKIIEDGENNIIENLEVKFKSNKLNISIEVTNIEDYLIIEFVRVAKEEDEAYLLNRICNKSKDLLFYKDSNLVYKYINDSYAKFLGVDKKDILGKSDRDILPEYMLSECLRTDMYALENSSYLGIEKAGNQYFRVMKECVDEGVMCLAQDITSEVELGELANVDELTKLPNRRKFNNDIEAIYKEGNEDYYMILVDIDNFSNINNTYGHDVGDKYLIELSKTLSNNEKLTFYRLGGDEFIGLINSPTKDVKNAVDEIFEELEKEKKISISVGVKKIDTSINYDKNYILLDETLYLSKKNGKNQVTYFNVQ